MQVLEPNKQPWETFAVSVDFSANMEDTEVIDVVNSLIKVYDYATSADVTDSLTVGNAYVVDNTKLTIVLTGGVSGTKYKASFRAYISAAKMLEEDIKITVKD